MDHSIRLAAFQWLEDQSSIYQGVLPRALLELGFTHHGQRMTLVGPKGIWKPRQMDLPISITTVMDGPYEDALSDDGFLEYKYRGRDPHHSDNVQLRTLMQEGIPLIYFHAIAKGQYHALWPVFIQGDDIHSLTFKVALDDIGAVSGEVLSNTLSDREKSYGRRAYLTTLVKQRLHQARFRYAVMTAYREQCTLCQLRHPELLDAAHIISDKEPGGQPVVQNGLSLCKIHHAAFDKNIIGINPDYNVDVRRDVLEEIDGPMLKYGLQELDKQKILLPKHKVDWPDQERLEYRYQRFLKAG